MLPLVSGNSENTHYGKSLLTTQDFHGMTSLSVSFLTWALVFCSSFFQLGPYKRFEKKQHVTHVIPKMNLNVDSFKGPIFTCGNNFLVFHFPSFFFRAVGTVDGRNPKQPPGMYKNPKTNGINYRPQLVSLPDFFHQQYLHVVFNQPSISH